MTTAFQRDKHTLTLRTSGPAAALIAGFALLVLPLGGWSAEGDLKGVGDPTRPPPGVMLKQQQMVGGAAGQFVNPNGAMVPAGASPAASAASDAEGGREELTGDRWAVSGIRIDKGTGQGVAIIGEDVVRVGDTIHGFKVMSISYEEVQLKGPEGLRKLKFSDVNELSGVTPVRSAKRGRKERK
jgi:hypothetical protein